MEVGSEASDLVDSDQESFFHEVDEEAEDVNEEQTCRYTQFSTSMLPIQLMTVTIWRIERPGSYDIWANACGPWQTNPHFRMATCSSNKRWRKEEHFGVKLMSKTLLIRTCDDATSGQVRTHFVP